MGRDRNDQGRYSDGIPPEEVLEVFDDREDRARPITATDVVDELGIARRTAHNKLKTLVERGVLDTRKVGARGRVYWIPILEGEETPTMSEGLPSGAGDVTRRTEREPAREASDENAGETPATDTNTESGRTRAESDDLAGEVRQYLEDTDTPPKTAHGRSAVIDVFRYLRGEGTAKTGAIQDAVYPEYADEWGSARTMWNAIDRYLEDVPGIEKGGYGAWTYTGDADVREELEGEL